VVSRRRSLELVTSEGRYNRGAWPSAGVEAIAAPLASLLCAVSRFFFNPILQETTTIAGCQQECESASKHPVQPDEKNACQMAGNQRSLLDMIIALVNSKGGVGKSTIAGNLAGWLHAQGKSVILVDCDSQQSCSEWLREAVPDMPIIRMADADTILDELPVLAEEADYIIADGPGSQTETSRALLMWADLAIVPCKASMFEARALDKNTVFIRQAQMIRKGLPEAVAVLSMVGKEYRLTKDMREAAASLNLSLTETAVTLRQAYADAPGQATFVWNMGSGAKNAANEIDSLFRELLPELGSNRVLPICKSRGRASWK
jgi:chromosome partitioning protein